MTRSIQYKNLAIFFTHQIGSALVQIRPVPVFVRRCLKCFVCSHLFVCVGLSRCVYVCRPISYFHNAYPNDASSDTSCDIRISPGSHECGESGRAIGRVQAFSFVAFKVQVYDFFLAGGGNQSSPLLYCWRRQQYSLSMGCIHRRTPYTYVCKPARYAYLRVSALCALHVTRR